MLCCEHHVYELCVHLQALSKALRELRADMVTQAKADVVAHANQSEQEFNVQKVVDKQTKILQVNILT